MITDSLFLGKFQALFSLVFVLSMVTGVQADETSFSDGLQQRLSAGEILRVGQEPIVERAILQRLYEKNRYRSLWERNKDVRDLMAWIERSLEEGLTPTDYHQALLQKVTAVEPDNVESRIDRELLLSDALALLAIHLSAGKVDAGSLFKEWNYEMDYSRQPSGEQVLDRFRKKGVNGFLQEQVPSNRVYQGLKRALATYRLLKDKGGWQEVPAGPTLHPGDSSQRVPLLRERLRITGDYNGGSGDSQLFDSELEAAVRDFQQRHGIDADGVMGKGTLAAMNIPVEARIAQLRVNMERLRWVLNGIPEDFYGVDLAGFTLFRGADWSSPIQVGSAYHQTPVFHDLIRIVEINPTWTVPMSITRRELAPRLLKDPQGYLQKKNMELLTPDGKPVAPASVNWSAVSASSFPYVLRQKPGPDNALGRIKFLFPNQYAVYLHDTPAKALFQRTQRAFSHGCVRVGKPLELGEQLLKPNGTEWTRAHIQKIIDSGETVRIELDKPVPVLILYLTALADGKVVPETVYFRNDVYTRDPKVLKALDGPMKEKGARLMMLYEKQNGEAW